MSEIAEALYDYHAANDKEISFRAGERMTVLEKNTRSGWWDVRLQSSGREGFAPSNHVQVARTQSQSPATFVCEARYDADEPNELTIVPGDRVRVLKRNDETGWYLCVSRRGKGWAPGSFLAPLD